MKLLNLKWFFVAGLFALVISGVNGGASGKPNLVFFLSDDQRHDFMGCAGHPILKTPTMDSLAAQGVRFRNMFVTTSICAASRASILTGLHERTHRYTFGTPPISTLHVQTSYPFLLRAGGYRTGFVGKFGVQVPTQQEKSMFDYFVPLNRSPYFKKQPDGSMRHLTDITGDHAIQFLQTQSSEQPFCLSVSFNAPHAEDGDKENHYPWPPSVDGLYEDLTIPPPRLSDPEVFESQPEFLKKSMNRVRWFWRWDTPEKYQKNVKAYYRMISGVDHAMGRVLKELERLGLSENTIVIFSGDNGYYKGDRGFAGKWSHYEESLRTPLIIMDPRVPCENKGKVVDAMALNLDIPATLLEYAGISLPTIYQGASLKSWVNGMRPPSWRSEFFCEHLMDHEQIPKYEGFHTTRWVYARYFQQDPPYEFLHDLEADPDQLRNLAMDDSYLDQLKRMRLGCERLRDQYGGAYSLEKIPTVKYLNELKRKNP